MFEIGSGELRATFLGNHSSEATERHDNTARHYVNEQRAATHQHGGHCTRYGALHPLRGTTPLTRHHTRYGAPHPLRGTTPLTRHHTRYGAPHPLRGSAPHTRHHTRYGAPHPLRGSAPHTRHCTPYGAPHPLRGATPVTRQCTPYGAVHPLRGTAPDQKGCNAYGSGAAPPITRTNAESARRGPGCGARGRWRGLAGQRTNNEPDRLEAAAGPAGPGRASSRRAERSSRRGRRAGGQATRRPEICRGNEQREAARLHRDRAAHTSGDSCQKPQISQHSTSRRRGRPRR